MIQHVQRAAAASCSIEVEDAWGPQVHGCGTDFDFTLLFHELVLFIGPLGVAVCWAALRIWQLFRQETVTASPVLYRFKLGGYVILGLLQTAFLVLNVSLRAAPVTRATVAACSLGVAGFVVLLAVSHLEHRRSVRASTLLLLYLGYSMLADGMRARTLWSMPAQSNAVATVLIASSVCKLVLFVIERRSKTIQPRMRRPTPDEEADILSRIFFWWMLPLFRLGRQTRTLISESLPDIEYDLTVPGDFRRDQDHDHDHGINAGTSSGTSSSNGLTRSSIFIHLLAVRGRLIVSCVPPRLCYTGFLFAQPFLIEKGTELLSGPSGPNTYKSGAGLVGAYLAVYVGIAASQAFYRHCTARTITSIRADLVTKIHDHTLQLSSSSPAKDAVSTLMSSDIEQFAAGSRNLHDCWACLIEVALALWLLEDQLRVATAAAGGLALLSLGLASLVVKTAGTRQNAWLRSVETRISGTTQALKAMKGIKMTGVESTIRSNLAQLRKIEVGRMRKFRDVLLVVMWAMWFPVITVPIICLTVYNVAIGPQSGRVLTPALVYRCLTLFGLYGNAVANLLKSMLDAATASAALLRIQAFLLGDNTRLDGRVRLPSDQPEQSEVDKMPLLLSSSPSTTNGNPIRLVQTLGNAAQSPPALQLVGACARWNTDGPYIVDNANLDVSAPAIVAIVGPPGSGKTTLLQLVLGEIPCAAGSVAISGADRIGYCSQTPWLTHESIRKNIVGSDEAAAFDEGWYSTVLHATALHEDLGAMPLGDRTDVGSAGSSLSGGQKKRIALARAIYSKAPVLVLDDPFNGLDGRTETTVLEVVLGPEGVLRQDSSGTLVIWTTSTVQQVRYADRVMSLAAGGSVRQRDSLLKSVVAGRDRDENPNESSTNTTAASSDTDVDPGRPLSFASFEALPGLVLRQTLTPPTDDRINNTDNTAAAHMPTKDIAAYRYYIGGAGKRNFMVFLGLVAVFVAGATLIQVWAIRWSENNTLISPTNRQSFYIGIFFTIGAVQLISWTVAARFFIRVIAERASDRPHNTLLDTLLSAPISFFDSTAAGNTINRFSQDLQLIDTELPISLFGVVSELLVAIGQCGIIIYGSPWSGLAIPVVAVAVYWVQRAYLPTSRQLRVLEIEAKGPLFSHFLETLSGLATIRALRWTDTNARKTQAAVTTMQKPFFLLFGAQNWLNLVLDLVTAGLAVAIMAVGVATRSQANSMFGMALLSASYFGATAKNLIQHWTQLEISMGAIERVRTFAQETPSEIAVEEIVRHDRHDHGGGHDHRGDGDGDSKTWQGRGSITFDHVSAKYTPSSPLVLRDISFNIKPGQRYAIVGRTGSGKSTLVATLLRLMPLDGGTISVDDTDISRLAVGQVRSRFITLPQDPVLIGGTVRHNMQLYLRDFAGPDYSSGGGRDEKRDREMIAVLEAFGLWETISAHGGLDAPLTDEEPLSHGQRQLFCFARSTLQTGNIVVLDEPSSQADRAAGDMMSRAIRETFVGRTVLCVAHKLSTILGFDVVVVMDAGSVVELGDPRVLLRDHSSLFSTLMQSQRDELQEEGQG